MDYYRIDARYFISLITWMPTCIILEIVEYMYVKCYDCKHFLLQEFACNKCKITRCQLHAFLNTSKSQCHLCFDTNDRMYGLNSIIIECIIPDCYCYAWYGGNDTIYYCLRHSKNKHNIIEYAYCNIANCYFTTNMINVKTNTYTCKIHQTPNTTYAYNYVKN